MSDIDITIYVNNKWHAQRRWPTVPRRGDDIVVANKDKNISVRVGSIVWGSMEEDFWGYQKCTVNLYCVTPEKGFI